MLLGTSFEFGSSCMSETDAPTLSEGCGLAETVSLCFCWTAQIVLRLSSSWISRGVCVFVLVGLFVVLFWNNNSIVVLRVSWSHGYELTILNGCGLDVKDQLKINLHCCGVDIDSQYPMWINLSLFSEWNVEEQLLDVASASCYYAFSFTSCATQDTFFVWSWWNNSFAGTDLVNEFDIEGIARCWIWTLGLRNVWVFVECHVERGYGNFALYSACTLHRSRLESSWWATCHSLLLWHYVVDNVRFTLWNMRNQRIGGRHLGMLLMWPGDCYCTWSTSVSVGPGGTVQFGTRTIPERFCMRSRDLMMHYHVYLEV